MGYKVIFPFMDKNDENRLYKTGETYPRKGFEVGEERLAELSSKKNSLNIPLIKKEEEKTYDYSRSTKRDHRGTRNRTE